MLGRQPVVGDLITVANPNRWANVYRVVEVDSNTVKINLYSEVTPVQSIRKFYKKSSWFRTYSHSDLNSGFEYGVESAYRQNMKAEQDVWLGGIPTLKRYIS